MPIERAVVLMHEADRSPPVVELRSTQRRNAMFSHVMVGANDLEASRKFYDAVLGTLGVPAAITDEKGRLFYLSPTGVFSVTKPIDGGVS